MRLVAVVGNPLANQAGLNEQIRKFAAQRLLRLADSEGNRGGTAVGNFPHAAVQKHLADAIVLLSGEEYIGSLRARIDKFDGAAPLIIEDVPLLLGQLDFHVNRLE